MSPNHTCSAGLIPNVAARAPSLTLSSVGLFRLYVVLLSSPASLSPAQRSLEGMCFQFLLVRHKIAKCRVGGRCVGSCRDACALSECVCSGPAPGPSTAGGKFLALAATVNQVRFTKLPELHTCSAFSTRITSTNTHDITPESIHTSPSSLTHALTDTLTHSSNTHAHNRQSGRILPLPQSTTLTQSCICKTTNRQTTLYADEPRAFPGRLTEIHTHTQMNW